MKYNWILFFLYGRMNDRKQVLTGISPSVRRNCCKKIFPQSVHMFNSFPKQDVDINNSVQTRVWQNFLTFFVSCSLMSSFNSFLMLCDKSAYNVLMYLNKIEQNLTTNIGWNLVHNFLEVFFYERNFIFCSCGAQRIKSSLNSKQL